MGKEVKDEEVEVVVVMSVGPSLLQHTNSRDSREEDILMIVVDLPTA